MRPVSHGFARLTTKYNSTALHFFLFFLLFYAFLALFVRAQSARDPDSVFFQPTAYDLSYSALRLEQADVFIDKVEQQSSEIEIPKASSQPHLCVGFATIARSGRRYFRSAVGTVLEGLSETERADIYLITLIAHTDPPQHPAYNETWLHKVVDRVLLYNSTGVDIDVDIDYLRSLEATEKKMDAKLKALFDYIFLLKACEAVGAPHIVILEDEIVAQDGWYHRTRAAIESAEEQTQEIKASKWLYLCLFYTILGWNSRDWPIFLFYSVIAIAFVASSFLGYRQYQPSSRTIISNEIILIACGVCTPLLIGLYFAAGRATMCPIPQGVHQMPHYASCSQAFAFPRTRVSDIVGWYSEKGIREANNLLEEFADNKEIRWAVTPSIVQHVGRNNSKTNKKGSVARLWNFEFEMNDPDVLREEHDRANNQGYSHFLGT
ncbi:hypothetical protein N7474_008275 [Penicillium riverlandense]|uniref:uncharacterized protein n=1 Tax=Penicillium riverlandense TaxID=1903569 RepID=UPI002548F008|nr:uncharacterized protein N7474_008275 [Penicillium riverlandense]KAJ5811974.1 hypothetical protein N7474_008275 [Penicillium riverlandense]